MDGDSRPQIILLPVANYWRWVRTARDFAVRFRTSITPQPQNAVNFNPPNQVITVANLPGGYAQGDIVQWLRTNAPSTALIDPINVSSVDDLGPILADRINRNEPYPVPVTPPDPDPPGEFRLRWPTDFNRTTQAFGVNEEYYRRFGLPGHEGVDIQAPLNAKVYACADGSVYRVDNGANGNAYGIHVRILHQEGYRTVYAHLNSALVVVGQEVEAGELIGLADDTGNSFGSHLHLTLKKDGATAAGQTNFPSDIINPTPFLYFPDEAPETPTFPDRLWPRKLALVGLHGRADGRMQEPDWTAARTGRVEAVKLLSSAAPEDVDRARQIDNNMFVLLRLFVDFRNRSVTASDFARFVKDDMARFYAKGIRYFEVHNEPNLVPEGLGRTWNNGREFGEWFLEVKGILLAQFPEAKLGWPGLSPGPTIPGIRTDEDIFLQDAGNIIRQADFVCCHCYWQNDTELNSRIGGLNYLKYREEYPDQLLFITEFSNPVSGVDLRTKAEQYKQFYTSLRNVPGVGAAFSFVVSASADFPYEVWRRENGQQTVIPGIVAQRGF